jgi:hypothetical protein
VVHNRFARSNLVWVPAAVAAQVLEPGSLAAGADTAGTQPVDSPASAADNQVADMAVDIPAVAGSPALVAGSPEAVVGTHQGQGNPAAAVAWALALVAAEEEEAEVVAVVLEPAWSLSALAWQTRNRLLVSARLEF